MSRRRWGPGPMGTNTGSSGLGHPETTIKVRVQPKPSRNQILGFKEDVLHARVTAPPERGKANDTLVGLLAERLGVFPSRVRVLKRHASRNKLVAIDAPPADDLRAYFMADRAR